MYRSSSFTTKEVIMLTLRAIFPGDPHFPIIRSFASGVYTKRLEVVNPANPDAFAALFHGDTPIACAGIFHATTHRPLFFERFFDKEILKEIDPSKSRCAFAELGALAVDTPPEFAKCAQSIAASILIAATLIAHCGDIEYLVFIGDRLLPRYSKLFGVPFTNYGRVTPEHIEPTFRAKLERYFSVGRNAYSVQTAPALMVRETIMPVLARSVGFHIHHTMEECYESLIPT